MLLTTKQVRNIAKAAGFASAIWTDKTSDYNEARRSVVWHFSNRNEADRLFAHMKAELAKQGATNTVKRTGVASDWMTNTWGGEYVRVIATLG